MEEIDDLNICPLCAQPIEPEDPVVSVTSESEDRLLHRDCFEEQTSAA